MNFSSARDSGHRAIGGVMSRQLPEQPNLQHLKKQAKELLRSMRQGKLADAQHAIAKEYGFATWAKLKLHVESLGLSPGQALKAAVCDSDASRVQRFSKSFRNCGGRSMILCRTIVSGSMRSTRRCSGPIGRRSRCCCVQGQICGRGLN